MHACISRIGHSSVVYLLQLQFLDIYLSIYLSAFAHLDLVGRPVESVAMDNRSHPTIIPGSCTGTPGEDRGKGLAP